MSEQSDAKDGALMDLKDVCRYLKISRRTVQTWRAGRKLPEPDFRLGRTLRWKRSTIEAWMARRHEGGG